MEYASLSAAYYMGKTLLWCGSVMRKRAEKKLSGEASASKKLSRVRREM